MRRTTRPRRWPRSGRMPGPAVPALLEALHGGDTALRREAMRALPRVGVPLGEVVEALVPLLTDPNAEVSHLAANMLNQQGPLPEECLPRLVPALIRVLEGRKGPANIDAMQILGNLGPKASGAVAALTEVVKGDEPEVASQAAFALRRIAPALVQVLEDKDTRVHSLALKAVAGIGPAARAAAPSVIVILRSGDSLTRVAAADVSRIFAETLTSRRARFFAVLDPPEGQKPPWR